MTWLATYVHDIDPFIFQFPAGWPGGGLRWYGTSYVLGFILCGLLIRRVTQKGRTTLHPYSVWSLVTTMAFGVVIGGRIGYVLFYDISLLGFTSDFPYWGLLAVNRGGMASHGGILGAIAASYYVARRGTLEPIDPEDQPKPSKSKKRKGKPEPKPAKGSEPAMRRAKHSWGHILDLAVLGTPLGLFFGRLANFINGELFGRAADPSFSLAVKFPQETERWLTTLSRAGKLKELNEKLLDLTNAVALFGQERAVRWTQDVNRWNDKLQTWVANGSIPDQKPPLPSEIYPTIQQLIVGTQQGDSHAQALIKALGPALTARHPSQLYQALLEGLALAIILILVYLKPRKPGVLSGVFVSVYGILRIVAEFWREPDAHLGLQWLGLTRGQWISMVMLIGGPVLIIISSRRKVEPMGGLLAVGAAGPVEADKPVNADKSDEPDTAQKP